MVNPGNFTAPMKCVRFPADRESARRIIGPAARLAVVSGVDVCLVRRAPQPRLAFAFPVGFVRHLLQATGFLRTNDLSIIELAGADQCCVEPRLLFYPDQ